jgi:rhodanese-related sulfurtransferase
MKFPIFFAVFFIACACNDRNAAIVKVISPADFAQKIKEDPDAQLLDVRTPAEYVGQHLEKAENIDWFGNDLAQKTAKYDKSKPIFVYCEGGSRSQKAAAKLAELGFAKVYDLQGGIVNWNAVNTVGNSDETMGLSPEKYETMVRSSHKVLIDFSAPWCIACKKMASYTNKIESTKIKIVRLNADEHKTMVSGLHITELPTLLLYSNGEIVWKHSGFISEADLKKQLQ